jgi:hypothetical protein
LISARNRRTILVIGVAVLSGLILHGCLRPNPVDMRLTLTVSATEILPTPTGFAQTISGGTPRPSGVGAGPVTTLLPSELTGGSPLYAVVLVGAGNLLNVRANAGIDQPILETLDPAARDIKLTGQEQVVEGDVWSEIIRPGGDVGWVNSLFLTQQVPVDAFCSTSKVRTLMRDFVRAIQEADQETLSRLINPRRGLTIRKEWWNNEVYFPPETIASLLADETSQSWGTDPVSGEPVEGSFREIILPLLRNTVEGDFTQPCNTLDFGVASGITSGELLWPGEYTNFNYMIIYKPGAQGEELGWRSWAVGIEIITGEPYISQLVQYHHEE